MIRARRRNLKPEACSLPCSSAPWATRKGAAPSATGLLGEIPPLHLHAENAHPVSLPPISLPQTGVGCVLCHHQHRRATTISCGHFLLQLMYQSRSPAFVGRDQHHWPKATDGTGRTDWQSQAATGAKVGTFIGSADRAGCIGGEAEGHRVWSDIPGRRLVRRDDARATLAGGDEDKFDAAADDANSV